MMIYATIYTTEDYFPQGILFENTADFCRACADKTVESVEHILRFSVIGEDYEDRKYYLKQLGINFSNADMSNIGPSEMAKVEEFFRKNGKRYGLLNEFEENGLC